MSKIKYFLPLLIFFVLAIFLLRGIGRDPQELPSPLIGKPFPAFSLPELHSGRMLSAADLKGRVVLVNVWATWCVSCRMEHPYLMELSRKGVVLIGLNYKDDPEQAKKWLGELGNPYTFNVVDEQGKLGLDLGVFGAPETFLLDKEGRIQHKHVGVIDERVWGQLQPLYLSLQSTTSP